MNNSFYSTIAKQFAEPMNYEQKVESLGPPEATVVMKQFESLLPKKMSKESLKKGKDQIYCINGYLSPEGVLYACRWRQHLELIRTLGFKNEKECENKGWVKLTQMKWLTQGRFGNITINQKQEQIIERWHEVNKVSKRYYELHK